MSIGLQLGIGLGLGLAILVIAVFARTGSAKRTYGSVSVSPQTWTIILIALLAIAVATLIGTHVVSMPAWLANQNRYAIVVGLMIAAGGLSVLLPHTWDKAARIVVVGVGVAVLLSWTVADYQAYMRYKMAAAQAAYNMHLAAEHAEAVRRGPQVCGVPNTRVEYEPLALAPSKDADPENYKLVIPDPDGADGCIIAPRTDPQYDQRFGWQCKDHRGRWHDFTEVDERTKRTYCSESYAAIELYPLVGDEDVKEVGVRFVQR